MIGNHDFKLLGFVLFVTFVVRLSSLRLAYLAAAQSE
jgi:hypothetical protein